MLSFHTISNWNKPRDGLFRIIADSWWMIDDENNPLFYGKHNAPQCNKNPEITKSIAKKFDKNIKLIPSVFIPINPKDYC